MFVNGNRSDFVQIATGFYRWSVLGPFQFLVYIKEFPLTFQGDNQIELFADDTSYKKTRKRNCNMQNDLGKKCDLFNSSKLSVKP